MRPAFVLGLGALWLAAGSARADAPAADAPAEAPSLDALPAATADKALTRPAHIEGSEGARGLWASVPREAPANASAPSPKHVKKAHGGYGGPPQRTGPVSVVTVAPGPVTTKMDATGYPRLYVGTPAEAGVCLRTSADGVTWKANTTSAVVLEYGADARLRVDSSEATYERIREEVWLVRAERLVIGEGDKASIEAVDAWVDLRTGGAREARRSTTQLSVVERLPGGLTVYGARLGEDRGLFVMKPPPAPSPEALAADTPAITVGTGEGQRGRCGFVRVELNVDNGGQSASDTINGEIAARADDEPGGHTLRIRSFRVSLGLSRFGTTGAPAVSASFGWTGRTRVETREPPATVPLAEPQL